MAVAEKVYIAQAGERKTSKVWCGACGIVQIPKHWDSCESCTELELRAQIGILTAPDVRTSIIGKAELQKVRDHVDRYVPETNGLFGTVSVDRTEERKAKSGYKERSQAAKAATLKAKESKRLEIERKAAQRKAKVEAKAKKDAERKAKRPEYLKELAERKAVQAKARRLDNRGKNVGRLIDGYKVVEAHVGTYTVECIQCGHQSQRRFLSGCLSPCKPCIRAGLVDSKVDYTKDKRRVGEILGDLRITGRIHERRWSAECTKCGDLTTVTVGVLGSCRKCGDAYQRGAETRKERSRSKYLGSIQGIFKITGTYQYRARLAWIGECIHCGRPKKFLNWSNRGSLDFCGGCMTPKDKGRKKVVVE